MLVTTETVSAPEAGCRPRSTSGRKPCTALYIIGAIVLPGLVNYRTLNVPDSLGEGIDATQVRWGSLLVKIGALGGLSSTMVVMLLGQSRVCFSMPKDERKRGTLLPKRHQIKHLEFVVS
jgi:amino acid transporter